MSYAQGEMIDLRIRRCRVLGYDEQAKHLTLEVPAAEGDRRYREVQVYVDMPTVSVERVAPPEWADLQPGDLWRTAPQPGHPGGLLLMYQHFVNNQYRASHRFVPAFESGAYQFWSAEQALRELGPLTLVYREPVPVDADIDGPDAGDVDADVAGDAR